MPLYDLKNNETGEIFELSMSISAYEQYLKDNPHIQRHFATANRLIDEVAIGRKKPPIDFKEGVIDRIKRANPLHKMESRWD